MIREGYLPRKRCSSKKNWYSNKSQINAATTIYHTVWQKLGGMGGDECSKRTPNLVHF